MGSNANNSVSTAATLHQSLTDEATATTAIPPTSAAPATPASPGNPERGNYNVTNGNGTACLMARMGLQLNVTFLSTDKKVRTLSHTSLFAGCSSQPQPKRGPVCCLLAFGDGI